MKDMTVEELIHELGNYETEDQSLENEINDLHAELLRRFEALKCCGNCYNDGDFCDFERCSPQKYCRRWQSDGLTREEREGK